MSAADLIALAERVEKASGCDEHLDAAIREATGIGHKGGSWIPQTAFTAHIDAAMTLVPEGWEWSLDNCGSETFGPWSVEMGDQMRFRPVEARTASLALTAAALRARAAQEGDA